jgi:hypothetical protein
MKVSVQLQVSAAWLSFKNRPVLLGQAVIRAMSRSGPGGEEKGCPCWKLNRYFELHHCFRLKGRRKTWVRIILFCVQYLNVECVNARRPRCCFVESDFRNLWGAYIKIFLAHHLCVRNNTLNAEHIGMKFWYGRIVWMLIKIWQKWLKRYMHFCWPPCRYLLNVRTVYRSEKCCGQTL